MLIRFDQGGAATLEDLDNFRSFKVLCPTTLRNDETIFSRVGRLDGTGYLWVGREWLSRNGRQNDIAWTQGLTAMVDYAATAGWLDPTGSIRAHLEFI